MVGLPYEHGSSLLRSRASKWLLRLAQRIAEPGHQHSIAPGCQFRVALHADSLEILHDLAVLLLLIAQWVAYGLQTVAVECTEEITMHGSAGGGEVLARNGRARAR